MSILQPEQTFAQYRIIRRIGVGGMATVFQAVDTQTNQKVALKVLHEQWSYHDITRQRFELEATIGSNLKHPGIVPIFGYGIEAERPYIVMKYMPGENLALEFKKHRSIQLSVTGKLLTLIGSALDYAHDKGVIHRDLKLENILLDAKRRPAIADFGIAKLIGTTRLTMTGQMIGTPQYMAPELWDTTSDQLDKYVDLYAFAVMAYLMATGYFPFTANDSLVLVVKHQRELPPIPTKVNPNLPRQLNPVLLRGLQKNPADRYPSALEFAEAFNQALADKDGHTTLIFMNELNPVRGKIIRDVGYDGLEGTALTPHVADTNILDEPYMPLAPPPATKELTTPPVDLLTRSATPYPPGSKNRRWLLVASILLSLVICGATFAVTRSNSSLLAPVGSYTLPTATALSSYSSESNAVQQAEIATMTALVQPESTVPGTGTAVYDTFNAVQVLETVTEASPTRRPTFQPTNTPLPMNTVMPVSTNAPIINTVVPPTPVPNTPVPPTPVPIVPTSIPIVATTVQIVPTVVEIVPTAIEIIPTVVNVLPPIGGGDNGDGDEDGGNSDGNGNAGGNGNGNANGNGNGGGRGNRGNGG